MPLDETQSWELFCSKFSAQDALQNPSIQPLARQVVKRCGGLPLALNTVGRAMANRKLRKEWEDAIRALDDSAEELQGMDMVISCLKFSYDNLESDKMRSALLYCAMYPEDYKIYRKELIDHWIGEGLLDVDGVDEHIESVRHRGHVLISNLQHACLLEAGIEGTDRCVRLPDAVRDMALWINNHDKVGKVDGFYLLHGDNATRATITQSRRNLIRRIWVRNSDLEEVPHYLKDANICTLRMTSFQSDKPIKPSLLQDFLIRSKRTLRVLDLSYSRLKELPVEEIGSLPELRYLNLTSTYLKSLPEALGGLDQLRQLELQNTPGLVRVPREAFTGLLRLQVLNLYDAGLVWNSNLADDVGGVGGRQLQLNDLQGLVRLQDLHIGLSTSESLEWLLRSDNLCSCTRHLSLNDCDLLRWVFDLNELPCLELLSLEGVSGDQFITIVGRNGGPSLKQLLISHSYGWKELKFVGRFPSLEEIALSSCPEMEELTLDDDDGLDSHFPMLREMDLSSLPALKSIGQQPLLFPSLQTINLKQCPMLKRLPLGPSSAPKLRVLRCGQTVWDAIEWGQDIKLIFEPFLVLDD